jgi:hypothetical protein
MTRRFTPVFTTSILTLAGIGFFALDRTRSADLEHVPEPDLEQYRSALDPYSTHHRQPSNVRIVTSDQTARFVSVGLNKSLLIELPGEFTEVMVGNTGIAIVRAASKRRAYIIGVAPGRTNMIFTNDNARPVAAVDVNVAPKELPPAPLEPSGVAINQVVIYRGPITTQFDYLSCTRTECLQDLNTSSKADANNNNQGPPTTDNTSPSPANQTQTR